MHGAPMSPVYIHAYTFAQLQFAILLMLSKLIDCISQPNFYFHLFHSAYKCLINNISFLPGIKS